MVNAVPRAKEKEKFKRPEAAALEAIILAFFEDIQIPAEEIPEQLPEQIAMELKAGE